VADFSATPMAATILIVSERYRLKGRADSSRTIYPGTKKGRLSSAWILALNCNRQKAGICNSSYCPAFCQVPHLYSLACTYLPIISSSYPASLEGVWRLFVVSRAQNFVGLTFQPLYPGSFSLACGPYAHSSGMACSASCRCLPSRPRTRGDSSGSGS